MWFLQCLWSIQVHRHPTLMDEIIKFTKAGVRDHCLWGKSRQGWKITLIWKCNESGNRLCLLDTSGTQEKSSGALETALSWRAPRRSPVCWWTEASIGPASLRPLICRYCCYVPICVAGCHGTIWTMSRTFTTNHGWCLACYCVGWESNPLGPHATSPTPLLFLLPACVIFFYNYAIYIYALFAFATFVLKCMNLTHNYYYLLILLIIARRKWAFTQQLRPPLPPENKIIAPPRPLPFRQVRWWWCCNVCVSNAGKRVRAAGR